MTHCVALEDVKTTDRDQVGGKALKLAQVHRAQLSVPQAICITTDAYRLFVRETGLDEQIALELNRLDLADRRWEEIWDVSLRIRNLFLKTPMPPELEADISAALTPALTNIPVAVRSSAPQEDGTAASFAGLHNSFVDLSGREEILKHIRLVWASLWSDGAILYRDELGISSKDAAMAVVVQELISGKCSGVGFTVSPDHANQMMIETVYGLNERLVDGEIEPDRWQLDRNTGDVVSHAAPAVREASRPLSDAERRTPPLDAAQIQELFETGMQLETRFGAPQDFEWTFCNNRLFVLQSRAITTLKPADASRPLWKADDKRPWYLTLTRSFENLQSLHRLIRDELLPDMHRQADEIAAVDLPPMTDDQLADEILRRKQIHQHWIDVYWEQFIPFAHGSRLFGEVYNDAMQPEDPYEFTALLTQTGMCSLERNRRLMDMAKFLRQHPDRRNSPEFQNNLSEFLSDYDEHTFKNRRFFNDRSGLVNYLLEMARHPELLSEHDHSAEQQLTEAFINTFPAPRREFAKQILEIGRASYQLRDDDNIVLSRIEAQLLEAVDQASARLKKRGLQVDPSHSPEQIARALTGEGVLPQVSSADSVVDEPLEHQAAANLSVRQPVLEDGQAKITARQMVGQPAGPGLAIGRARVIQTPDDLFEFKSGEILVCDSIDPNMTFIVPLAAAIVERRGGMLVHGAIIAREYGLPCITGVTDASAFIQTGDRLTVDGYQGVVTIQSH
jgi:pyruvate,water dikinase